MAQRLIVIGGDAAGMSAASAARRQLPRGQLEIVAFERGHYTSYSACGIPYFIGKDVAEASELIARTPQQFRDHHDIDARTGHEVQEIDLHRRAVLVRELPTGRERWEGFDQLMIATGATPARPPLPGIQAQGIYGVQTLDDGLALRAVLERDRPGRAVVVGAGYIGLELAEALCAWGVDITVIGRPPAPLPGLDPDMGMLIASAMEGFGMEVRMEETVTGFGTRHGTVTAVVTDQATIPTDLVILGLGVEPNTALAAQAGIPLGRRGRSRWTAGCAPGSKGCGPEGTAWRSSTVFLAATSRCRWARTRTRRAAPPGSTSAAATPPSPGCWVRP
ncbi:NAD(P)/FAD-dependent oxidoreductase [Kocuria flava]|uniref:NAD(P)/FAD-dependent oxidoreductase n=1 Tax=Kocuria flava TaxID=446860 RepID=UPI001C5F03AE|nr:FAD-dependent oxidoreductase [Kocuria flava]